MKPPVFIVGCPRSGTSFLYHLLLSAGGFAEFRTQMNAYDVLDPIYAPLSAGGNRSRMMREWLRSKAFQVSGLDAVQIEAKVQAECRSVGDFLRIVMDQIAGAQGADRWIDATPTNIPHLLRIALDFPDGQFLHIIRDPRDVALSLVKRGWARPLPWDKHKALLAAGLYWEWMVRKGRRLGAQLQSRYFELRYEELVEKPREVLPRIGEFLQHDLDYDRIQRRSVGSVKTPLTAFSEDLERGEFKPVGRWKENLSQEQLQKFEDLIGGYMTELGYVRATSPGRQRFFARRKRLEYGLFYGLKQWAKVNTPLSRWFVDYSEILIDK
jgi:Sulfotransferase family